MTDFQKELEKLKLKLEKERKKLIQELKELEQPEEFGGDVGDLDEEADELEEFSVKISESQSVRERINEIDRLINKIDSGTYGFCDKCKKEISKEELKKDPELIFCSACQKNKKAKK
ncbi:MAG: TraR/DksA family transcriptional regulator [Minisyncoccia bacterium]